MTLCSEWALYTTWTFQLLLSSASSYSDMKQHCRPVWHCYVFLGAVETHQPQAHTHTLMLRTETMLHGMCAHVRNCFSWLHCEAVWHRSAMAHTELRRAVGCVAQWEGEYPA